MTNRLVQKIFYVILLSTICGISAFYYNHLPETNQTVNHAMKSKN